MADTVELMRKRVLDMAIRGELVEQRPEEGTARELLNTIEDKRKAMSVSPSSKTYDIPFKLPNSWEWTTLDGLSSLITDGTHKTPTYVDEGVPFLSIKNISQGYLDLSNIKYTTQQEHEELIKRCNPQNGDIMFCRIGTLGRVHLIEDDFEFSIFVSLGLIKLMEKDLGMYLKHMLSSPEFYRQVDEVKVVGSHASKLNLRDARNIKVPLPPLAEQKRIVAKIEEIFAVIDQIGTKKEEALSIIRNICQTALQDAIKGGRLVAQEENDEPAPVLYEKIQAEKEQLVIEKKIKKEKPFPEIDKNEIPFEIPKNWRWTRLGDLGFFKKGPFGSALTKSIFVEDSLESIKVYEQKNAIQSDCTLGEYFITKDYYEEKMASNTVMPGDIIVSCAGTIGKSYIIPDGARLGIINQALMRIRVYTINKQYFRLIFNHVIQTDGAQGKGSAIKNIPPMKVLNNLLVPLPPLAEQERIVEKIDEIMAICDQMEAIFDGSSEVKEDLKVV